MRNTITQVQKDIIDLLKDPVFETLCHHCLSKDLCFVMYANFLYVTSEPRYKVICNECGLENVLFKEQ